MIWLLIKSIYCMSIKYISAVDIFESNNLTSDDAAICYRYRWSIYIYNADTCIANVAFLALMIYYCQLILRSLKWLSTNKTGIDEIYRPIAIYCWYWESMKKTFITAYECRSCSPIGTFICNIFTDEVYGIYYEM